MTKEEISSLMYYFYVSLIIKTLTKKQIVEWVDMEIAKSDIPDQWLVDISLAENEKPQDFYNVLQKYIAKGSAKPDGVLFLAILSHHYYAGKMTMGQTIQELYSLMFEVELDEEIVRFIYGIEGDYEMSHGEIDKELYEGSFTPIKEKLDSFFIPYRDLSNPFPL